MASAFLAEDFAQTNVFVWICIDHERACINHERVCLYMHRFCSFDNWLCDPISENWRLMLSDFSIAKLQFYGETSNLRGPWPRGPATPKNPVQDCTIFEI